jgi:hypothetical protein
MHARGASVMQVAAGRPCARVLRRPADRYISCQLLGNPTLAIRISCKQMIMERYPSIRSAAEDALE